jgi:hypothetical protein
MKRLEGGGRNFMVLDFATLDANVLLKLTLCGVKSVA